MKPMILSSGKPPSIDEQSFTCPHCGALAHQSWWRVSAEHIQGDSPPSVKWGANQIASMQVDPDFSESQRQELLERVNKLNTGMPSIESSEKSGYGHHHVNNVNISQCYSCRELAVWLHDRLIFPQLALAIEASPDMPAHIKLDFDEARQIYPLSPRGAASLLRLSIQKLCIALGEKGKNIDDDIASLVKKGLSTEIQQALDVVRVIGNEAVHPGQIDLNDDPSIAQTLFELVNMVVDEMISKPNKIKEMYEKLPPTKLDAIKRRDTQKTSSGK